MVGSLTNGKVGMLGSDYHWAPNTGKEVNPHRKGYIQNGNDFSSSAIYSVDFRPGRGEAMVRYNSNPNKSYTFPMNGSEFEELNNAPSKGKFMYYNARRY